MDRGEDWGWLMIIIKIKGGLGNQLFQYALGRHLSIIHNSPLKMDVSMFKSYKWHEYSMSPFNIQGEFAENREIPINPKKRYTSLKSFIVSWVKRVTGTNNKKYIEEKAISYDDQILMLGDDIYLDGYWQSECYFKDIEPTIRREFAIRLPQSGTNREVAEDILSCESVSLHIRRGTYVNDKNANSTHGVCDVEYYEKSLDYLKRNKKDIKVFVFSDDPQWVLKNLSIEIPFYVVNHNDAKNDFEDLRLMSQCKNHIIANSTFSWWGAWLCSHQNKVVIAPRKWYADENLNQQTNDLIPDRWIRI